jgi:hypothetical protein
MPEVTLTRHIEAPAEEVWATIADFAAIQRYSPMVAQCTLEGPDGVGQRRRLILSDGGVTVSRLAAIDPEARSLTYEILETRLPLADYSSTQTVRPIDAKRCEVTWSSHFQPRGASEQEASDFLNAQLDAGLEELRALHERTEG